MQTKHKHIWILTILVLVSLFAVAAAVLHPRRKNIQQKQQIEALVRHVQFHPVVRQRTIYPDGSMSNDSVLTSIQG